MSDVVGNGWRDMVGLRRADGVKGYAFMRDCTLVGKVVPQWGAWVCIHPAEGEVDIFERLEEARAVVETWPTSATPDGFIETPQIDLFQRWLYRRDGKSVCYLECAAPMTPGQPFPITSPFNWRVTRLSDRRCLSDYMTRDEAAKLCRSMEAA